MRAGLLLAGLILLMRKREASESLSVVRSLSNASLSLASTSLFVSSSATNTSEEAVCAALASRFF
eukprot:4969133-Prymnesium_polylepis.3